MFLTEAPCRFTLTLSTKLAELRICSPRGKPSRALTGTDARQKEFSRCSLAVLLTLPPMAGKVTDSDLPIETARLKLRRFREDDAESLLALYGNPQVVRYLYTEPMQRDRLGEALQRRLRPAKLEVEGDVLELAAELRTSGEFVGTVTLFHRSSEHSRGEIGYTIAPEFWGHGFAREGATALLRIGFELLGLHRLEGQCDARNLASVRVMEVIGMRKEAHLRENEFVKGEWTDEILFAMLADEWARLQGTD